MPQSMHEMVQALCDPVPTRQREALNALESLPKDQVERFFAYARDLQASTCVDLATVLANTRVPLLIKLLSEFAAREEDALRQRALLSLMEIPAELRMAEVKSLLGSGTAAVRAGACELLAHTNAQSARSDMVQTLDDPEPAVVMAALGALERLAMHDTVHEITRLMRHDNADLRARAIDVVSNICRPAVLPVEPVITCLENDPDQEVRLRAAVAIGKHAPANAATALSRAFGAEKAMPVKAAIAAAMGSYPSGAVIRDLLRAKARESDPAIVLQCRMAMRKMPEALLVTEFEQLLNDDDPMVRMEAAAACGEFAFDSTREMLLKRLREDKDEMVVATIVESLGHAGWPKVWPEVYKQVARSPLIAYAAIDTLAELLEQARLGQFAALLDELDEPTLVEAVLKRLALYGRSNGLPPTIFEPTVRFVRDNVKLSMLALQVIGCINAVSKVAAVAELMRRVNDPAVGREIARAAYAVAGQDAMVMFRELGPDRIDILARMIRLLPELKFGRRELIEQLARLLPSRRDEAVGCLRAIAGNEPGCFAAVMPMVTPAVVAGMLEAWLGLPPAERRRTNLPFEYLLAANSSEVRLKALTLIPVPGPDSLLARVATLALTDEDEVVRRAARDFTRRMVEAVDEQPRTEKGECVPTSA